MAEMNMVHDELKFKNNAIQFLSPGYYVLSQRPLLYISFVHLDLIRC